MNGIDTNEQHRRPEDMGAVHNPIDLGPAQSDPDAYHEYPAVVAARAQERAEKAVAAARTVIAGEEGAADKTDSLASPEPMITPPVTELTGILDQDAALHPELWSEDSEPLFGRDGRVALKQREVGVTFDDTKDPDVRTGAKPLSSRAWLVNAYGSRWAPNAEGDLTLQTTKLENLSKIHDEIVRTVLVDEHSRPTKLVDAVEHPAVGTYTDEGVRVWAQTLNDGFSPVLATGKELPDGRKEYLTHDYTDWHTASNLLWGRATQDRVTKITGYELKRRETGFPPLEVDQLGKADQQDGIGIVDRLTCNSEQISLIDYAMHGPGESPKERMTALWEQFNATDFDDPAAWEKARQEEYLHPEAAAVELEALRDGIGEAEDFIQWYEHDGARRATPEEKQAAFEDALIDITRVAEKLQGVHDGTNLTLERPHNAEDNAPTELYPEDHNRPYVSFGDDSDQPEDPALDQPAAARGIKKWIGRLRRRD